MVVKELKHQNSLETSRLEQERQKVDSLTRTVQSLETELADLKTGHHLESQKMKLLLRSVQEEAAREAKAQEESASRVARLQEELEQERSTARRMVQELESQGERGRRERTRATEERRRLAVLEEELEEERGRRVDMEKMLGREERQAEQEVERGATLQDLKLQLNLATKKVRFLCWTFHECYPRPSCWSVRWSPTPAS